MDWFSLLLPFAYLTILTCSLVTFSYLYRTRKASQASSLTPWFPPHLQRNIYLSLLELQQPSTSHTTDSTDTKIPDSVLRAALLRRATEDIHRLIQIRNAKPALAQLLQRGSVGDELWQRFLLAEKEIEVELKDVVTEANALAPQQNWGATIFQSASECAHNELLRGKLREIEARRVVERREWEKRRESVREGFMRELESEAGKDQAKETSKEMGKEITRDVKKTGSSDDDAVIVESGGPGTPVSVDQPSGGGGKKKKGKK